MEKTETTLRNLVDFTRAEHAILRKIDTQIKIQNYLQKLAHHGKKTKDTIFSPQWVMREKKAHCIEGAFLAAVALWYHGQRPLLMDLKSNAYDFDHVVALYRKFGKWGAISKTAHAVLRYRDPVYANPRELAMSYFHEYFTDDGIKTLRSWSEPFDLSKLKNTDWIISEKNLWHLSDLLDKSPHHAILDRRVITSLRKADPIEIAVGKMKEV